MSVFLVVVGVVVGISAFCAWIFMLLWNWIIPYLFGWPNISFWMAWGIMLLISILFGDIKIKSRR